MRDEQMRRQPRVSVVVPALNEAENLRVVLPRLPQEIHEVVLVDGGSCDETVAVARECWPGVRVLRQPGTGKGNAIVCGLTHATGEVIVLLDADGSARPEEISVFVGALMAGADFAKGSRMLAGGGSADITRVRSAGNRLLTAFVNLLFGTRYTDLCYGYNAFWARVVPELSLDADGFEIETQLNLRAAKAGLVVVEVPSFEDARIHGVSNLRAFQDGLRVLQTILRERFGVTHQRRTPAAAPLRVEPEMRE